MYNGKIIYQRYGIKVKQINKTFAKSYKSEKHISVKENHTRSYFELNLPQFSCFDLHPGVITAFSLG